MLLPFQNQGNVTVVPDGLARIQEVSVIAAEGHNILGKSSRAVHYEKFNFGTFSAPKLSWDRTQHYKPLHFPCSKEGLQTLPKMWPWTHEIFYWRAFSVNHHLSICKVPKKGEGSIYNFLSAIYQASSKLLVP